MDGTKPVDSSRSICVGMQMTSVLESPTRSSNLAGGRSTVAMESQVQGHARREETIGTGGKELGMSQLYTTSRMRRPELWQFIRLVVPDPPHTAAGRTYTNQDAKEAYCLKCKRRMHYSTGSSNNVSRHMAKYHAMEMANYEQRVEEKTAKNTNQQHREASDSDSGTGHKRRRIETAMSSSSSSAVNASRLSLISNDNLPGTRAEYSTEELTQDETRQLNAILARWTVKHHHPLTITEDPELHELLRFAAALHKPIKLPSPSTVRTSIQSLSARTRMKLMRQMVSEVRFYSMASEVWVTTEKDRFVSFSIHYLTENFELRHFTLDVREYSGHQPFSNETKREILDTLISHWNLDSRYLSSMLWQSQPRVDVIGNTPTQLYTQQAESAAHGFEVILTPLLHGPRDLMTDGLQMFFCDEMVNNAMANVPAEYRACVKYIRDHVILFRDLAVFFTNHPRAKVCLDEFMTGRSRQRLRTDSKSSWLDTLDMLKHLVKKRDVIRGFFSYVATSKNRTESRNGTSSLSPSEDDSRIQCQEPTDQQWCAIECLLQLLQPFENVALAIGKKKYAASSLTFPLLQFLKRDLERGTNFQRVLAKYSKSQRQNIATQLKAVRNFLCMEFKAHFSRACGELMWVSQLDPRFVRMKYLSDEEREVCKTQLIDQCIVLANFDQTMTSQRSKTSTALSAGLDPSSATSLDLQAEIQPTRENHDPNYFLCKNRFHNAHDYLVPVLQQQQQQRQLSIVEQEEALRMRVVNEVQAYYDIVAVAKMTAIRDPLIWWRNNSNSSKFPLLVPLARRWLSSVGSVRPSEAVQINIDRYDDLNSISTSQDLHSKLKNQDLGHKTPTTTNMDTALPYSIHAAPEFVRDIVFVRDNCS